MSWYDTLYVSLLKKDRKAAKLEWDKVEPQWPMWISVSGVYQ